MSRKRCHRQALLALPPRGMRRKLPASKVTTIAIAHMQNLDDVMSGKATVQVLWDMAESVFTWMRVAEVLGQGVEEMAPQLEVAAAVIERFGRTGRIGFSGLEYQKAKHGVQVMDELAAIVDADTAKAAAAWSDRKLAALVSAERQKETA